MDVRSKRIKKLDEMLMNAEEDQLGLKELFLDGIISKIFTKKVNLGLVLFSAYIGAKNYELVQRVEDYIFRHNIKIEETYFEDPRGLSIDIKVNSKGRREVYLYHKESGKRYSIKEDVFKYSK